MCSKSDNARGCVLVQCCIKDVLSLRQQHAALLNLLDQAHHCPATTSLLSIVMQPHDGLHVAVTSSVGQRVSRATLSPVLVEPLDRFKVSTSCSVICVVLRSVIFTSLAV